MWDAIGWSGVSALAAAVGVAFSVWALFLARASNRRADEANAIARAAVEEARRQADAQVRQVELQERSSNPVLGIDGLPSYGGNGAGVRVRVRIVNGGGVVARMTDVRLYIPETAAEARVSDDSSDMLLMVGDHVVSNGGAVTLPPGEGRDVVFQVPPGSRPERIPFPFEIHFGIAAGGFDSSGIIRYDP